MNVHLEGGMGATLLLGSRCPQQAPNAQQLRDLDRVGRGPLAEVVAHDPEVQAALMRRVAAYAPKEVAGPARHVDGGRVDRVGGVVHHDNAGRLGEQLPALVGREGLAGLDVGRHGMAGVDRDARAGGGDGEVRPAEDLARLEHALALLGRVVVALLEGLHLRQDVERDLVRVDGRRGQLVRLDHRLGLAVQLLDGALAGARHGLVGGHDHPLDPDAPEDRAQRHDRLHGGAVRVGDDAAVVPEGIGVDLGHHERHVLIHAPLRGVVYDDRAGVHEARGPLSARARAGAEEGEVEALDGVLGEGCDGEVRVAGRSNARARRSLAVRDGSSCGALACERHDLVGRERALAHDAEDRRAHGAGGAYDGDPHASGTLGRWSPATSSGRTASAPSSKAVCSWRTAVSTCSSRTTQEILIGEVEIISMLTSASPSTVSARPATPGRSGRPMSVMRASEVECVTAVTRGRSMVISSSWTTVPGPSSKLDRQWIVTPWFRAYSTERSCSTPAPEAAISSISSKVSTGSLRASGTMRGSALKTPATSVKISQTSAPSAAASATAVVSEPPRPSVVTSSDSCETPWKPATSTILPSSRPRLIRSAFTSMIFALVWPLSVTIPAW